MAAQIPDILILDGTKMDLYSNPLESYFDLYSYSIKRPAFQATESCKRGYVATLELHNHLLILREIKGNIQTSNFIFWKKVIPYSWKMLFPKVQSNGVVASWFTGKIRIPQGNKLFYVHHAYDSRFEREIIITFDKGEAIKTVELDYTQQKLVVGNLTSTENLY